MLGERQSLHDLHAIVGAVRRAKHSKVCVRQWLGLVIEWGEGTVRVSGHANRSVETKGVVGPD